MAPCALRLRGPLPRLGRLPGRGLAPQTPRAAPPGAPSRTGPLLPRSPSRRGFRARVRRWRGGATACGCPCPTPSPSPLPWIQFFKSKATGAWASRRLVHRRASVPAAAAVGRSGTACRAAVHLGWAAGLSTAKAGHRAERQRHPAPGSRPAAGAPPYVDS